MAPPVLLATCARLPDGDDDAAALTAALERAGLDARWVVWTDPHVDWDEAVVVVRSVWDYQWQREALLAWAGSLSRVLNPADVLDWNTDKIYLRDLADAGVPVVPTRFAAPGDLIDRTGWDEFVVKPSVGAGSRGAGRFTTDRLDAAREHAADLHADGRTVLVQPYLDSVDTAGETALVYFAGRFSHAIRKGPMLPAGTVHAKDAEDLFSRENIADREAQADELAVGEQVLDVVRRRFDTDLLYARVDLLRGADGPVLIELDVTDPSLFLDRHPGAADAFAATIAGVAA